MDIAGEILDSFGGADRGVVITGDEEVLVSIASWAADDRSWWIRLRPGEGGGVTLTTEVGGMPDCEGVAHLLAAGAASSDGGVVTTRAGAGEPVGAALGWHVGVLEGIAVLGGGGGVEMRCGQCGRPFGEVEAHHPHEGGRLRRPTPDVGGSCCCDAAVHPWCCDQCRTD